MSDNKENFIQEVYEPRKKNICIECGSSMVVLEHLSPPGVSCSNIDCYNYRGD